MNAPIDHARLIVSTTSPDLIHGAVCEVLTGIFPTVRPETLLSSEKVNQTTWWVRQIGMFLMADRLQLSQTATARQFGRDRTTVSHACQLCRQEAAERPATAAFFDFLEAQVLAALDGETAR
jgi:chromosomal replication initiation ATPase DnaA